MHLRPGGPPPADPQLAYRLHWSGERGLAPIELQPSPPPRPLVQVGGAQLQSFDWGLQSFDWGLQSFIQKPPRVSAQRALLDLITESPLYSDRLWQG